jgi:hypothetical protein
VLLDSEVLDVLEARGALRSDRFSVASTVEKQAAAYLAQGCDAARQPIEAYLAFKQAVSGLQLASAELHQLMNLKPRTAVVIHLIVESLEDRFDERADEVVAQIIAAVNQHFPAQPV